MQPKNVFEKNKREIIVAIFVFLIVTTSFALGYLTATHFVQKVPIVIEKCSN
ncbi:MAG TPA: hypothetical protein PLB74_01325 [Candidatus Paceibacterota bacterium]|nr:hypothetical protein [Candidatus Paceibacterota bacterium]HOK20694.1 hypothetical protein [Candidatus Paceibacterota bacterium]HOL53812.1 hypothetical protein [Candidatus Paceibacterota bacterium]HON21575.1 hypothetical protein [Candidatus Paceibacterota bacterium]HOV88688.1 hypothetical protein [Candidatus Paceibacterota bacterium]